MKALIKVGYACNENCTFCHTADLRHIDDSNERVLWKIERAKKIGATMVVLSGGEPTIRPELLAWSRRVAALGMDLGLVTNGLLLSYPEVARELIESCRLRYVYMSLHGGSAKVHGSVVRADTFQRAMDAIREIHGKIPDFTINCVVTTANVEHLRALVDRLIEFRELTIKLSMTQPKGGADRAFDVIVPDVERAADRIKDAIEYGMTLAPQGRFAHDGIPLCLLPGLEHLYDDLKTHRFATMIEADEDDFVPVDDVAKTMPTKCDDCALRGPCPGLYTGYFQERGDAALKPVTRGVRSNSYTFVEEREIARAKNAPCPILSDGTLPYDRGRTLFLRLKDRMRLVRTESRDFTDAELLATKETLGQIYVDVSKKLAPDDFSKDLKKLRLSRECAACEARARCTGCWELMADDVFRRDDEAVLAILRSMKGRVLDLGCGEGPYIDALAREDVAYLGIDPDEEKIRALRSRHPHGRFDVASAESFASGERFDHVTALRSVNHFADASAVIAHSLKSLDVGGTLLLVDNVAFGVVRTKQHAARAENAPQNRFEHHRNDGADTTMRRLKDLPLEVIERRDVGMETSNQWLLWLRKTA